MLLAVATAAPAQLAAEHTNPVGLAFGILVAVAAAGVIYLLRERNRRR